MTNFLTNSSTKFNLLSLVCSFLIISHLQRLYFLTNFPHSGHYTAYAKHWQTGQWHSYNDSRWAALPHVSWIRTIHPKNKFFLQILSACNNWYVAFFRVSKCSSSNVITNEAYLLFFELSSWPPRWSCHCDPPNPCDPQDSLLGRQDPLICKISASARVRKHFLSTTIVKCNTLRLEVPRLIVTGLVTGILLQPAD